MKPSTLWGKVWKGLRLVVNTAQRLGGGALTVAELYSFLAFHRDLPRPPVLVQAEDTSDGTVLLNVGGTCVWWPREYSRAWLDLVWSEVFLPHPPNGHSYEHSVVPLNPGAWVLDVGACEGFFVKYALAKGCRVVAVEPVKRLAHCLGKTFRREVRDGLVRVINVALGGSSGTTHLLFDGTPIGAHEAEIGEEVQRLTLDELILRQRVVPTVDFIKIDVEGAESSVVRGGLQTVRQMKPTLAIAVYHYPNQEEEVRGVLREARTDYLVLGKGVLRNGSALVHQILHVR